MRKRRKQNVYGALLVLMLVLLNIGLHLYSRAQQTGAANPEPTVSEPVLPFSDPVKAETEQVASLIRRMTPEEMAAQLFIITPEQLLPGAGAVTSAGEEARAALQTHPVAGLIFFEDNLTDAVQVRAMLEHFRCYGQEISGAPLFLCVDEEGGSVARIGENGRFNVPRFANMNVYGTAGDTGQAYGIGREIGRYLSELGFNVDFAPVADVWSHSQNRVVRWRSFGSDPEGVARMARAVSAGLESWHVLSCYKHFPGHGSTVEDTHDGYAMSSRTLEELLACDLLPFQDGVDRQVPMMMAGHISLPNALGEDTPASLSYAALTGLLRETMGYEGLVVTDAMNMGAIVRRYGAGEAAVRAIRAGADLVLMPADFDAAYRGVLAALTDGTLPRARVEQSLQRIFRAKLRLAKAGGAG